MTIYIFGFLYTMIGATVGRSFYAFLRQRHADAAVNAGAATIIGVSWPVTSVIFVATRHRLIRCALWATVGSYAASFALYASKRSSALR